MAETTPIGPNYGKLMDEKRLGILDHLAEGDRMNPEVYIAAYVLNKCIMGSDDAQPLFHQGETYKKVKHYLNKPDIKSAICKLSPVGQTSRLESYHHIVLGFAPKHLSFGYQAMTAR